MKYLSADQSDSVSVGLAYGPVALQFAQNQPELVDHIEIPFEQLRHDPTSRVVQNSVPVILHCASMSVAGFVPPSDKTLDAIADEANRCRTPWIGEHLAFVSAHGLSTQRSESAPPTELTYTICPQLSDETLHQAAANLSTLRSRFQMPIIVENAPQYFEVPGSEMSMSEFLTEVVAECDVGLLFDISHFIITAINMGFDPMNEITRIPLNKIVEIHLSGYSVQMDRAWDDHSNPATELEFQLLDKILEVVRPQAITFEYNWGVDFPDMLVVDHLRRVRRVLS